MSNTLSDKTIKQYLAGEIKAVVSTPQVFPFCNLDPKDLSKWAGKFSYTDDNVKEIVHGWSIFRADRGGTPKSHGCQDYEWTYNVWGFYLFRPGGSSDSNSDDEFSAIIDAVADRLNEIPCWNIDTEDESFSLSHEGIKFPQTILRCGDERLHWAPGTIKIKFDD
jgi:hypothetical protein